MHKACAEVLLRYNQTSINNY